MPSLPSPHHPDPTTVLTLKVAATLLLLVVTGMALGTAVGVAASRVIDVAVSFISP